MLTRSHAESIRIPNAFFICRPGAEMAGAKSNEAEQKNLGMSGQ